MRPAHVVCEAPELAVECRRAHSEVPITVAPLVRPSGPTEPVDHPGWFDQARDILQQGVLLGLCLLTEPAAKVLIELADLALRTGAGLLVCVLRAPGARCPVLEAGSDLGIVVTADTEPLLIALTLLAAGCERPWMASIKGLALIDRLRLDHVLTPGGKRSGYLSTDDGGQVEFRSKKGEPALVRCTARTMVEALTALRQTEPHPQRMSNTVDDVDDRAVIEILFGPRRALSDPASKAALTPYGLPLPLEELCTSPSRAAAEATRIGFPVRIALASPDLRVWDHPELAVDMLDTAAQVRDNFRELQALAGPIQRSKPGERSSARILGVTVMATARAVASFRVFAYPLPSGRVGTELAFADPHGVAAQDRTLLFLPGAPSMVERAVGRLAGAPLVLSAECKQRDAYLEALADVLLRTAAFVNDRRAEVESVELRPVALLEDGSAEVREACVVVSDAFERDMDAAMPR